MSARHRIVSPASVAMLAATLLTASCGGPSTPTADSARPADGPWTAAQLFDAACASCHGRLGEGGWSGVPLNEFSAADRPLILDAIRRGVGAMPATTDGMSDEQVKALAEYVAGLR